MRLNNTVILGSLLLAYSAGSGMDAVTPVFHGAGWVQFGRIENSFATRSSSNNYDENWLGNYGGLVGSRLRVNDHWDAGLGFGTILVHLARGSVTEANIWYPFWVGFLTEARLTYTTADFAETGGLKVNLGAFGYNYNPDSKNLGVYLLKGYVYPGTLVSGYADLFGVPATLTGAMATYKVGGLTNDLILNMETEDKPLYDLSIADVVTWRPHPSLEIGAGANFYRLIPSNKRATSPGKDCTPEDLGPYAGSGPGKGQESPCFIVDTTGGVSDTIPVSLSGIKLMTRLRIDPKPWFGAPEILGPNDLVFYGEAALLGVKDYPIIYDNVLRRIPVMVGFNLPTFNLFNLSVEVEYYASKFSSDNLPPQNGSPLPSGTINPNPARDDWKWSVNASRMVLGNIFMGLQVANDHLRMGGTHNSATGREAMRIPEDWYWAFKTAYFF